MEVITGIITLQMIFSKYWEAFRKWHTGEIREAVISNVERISKCGEVKLIPHSCKSRFCSSCGKIATDRWIRERISSFSFYTSLAIKNSMSGKQESNV